MYYYKLLIVYVKWDISLDGSHSKFKKYNIKSETTSKKTHTIKREWLSV